MMEPAPIEWKSAVAKVIIAVLLIVGLFHLIHQRAKLGSQNEIDKAYRQDR